LELHHYDRILWLDADCLVSPLCPDIFAHVPDHYQFAAWCGEPEAFDPYSADKRPKYRHGYFNSGVFLASDMRPFVRAMTLLSSSDFLLSPHEQHMAMGEQTPFNKAVHELKIDVYPLEPAWNFILPQSVCRDLGISTTLESAHIVHCAGSSHLQVSDHRCRVSRAAGMRDLRRRLGW
jgi:lipopolysaccharide biosynthesis glycosyltransferase